MSDHHDAKIERPNHPLPRSYVEPIIFLADQMARKNRIIPVPENRMVDELADAAGIDTKQIKKWFHGMDDDDACEKIDLDLAKMGALVVMALVLKTDTTGGDEATAYFTMIRKKLGADPITVPSNLEAHKELALSYLED